MNTITLRDFNAAIAQLAAVRQEIERSLRNFDPDVFLPTLPDCPASTRLELVRIARTQIEPILQSLRSLAQPVENIAARLARAEGKLTAPPAPRTVQ